MAVLILGGSYFTVNFKKYSHKKLTNTLFN